MADIFISYSRQDSEQANLLSELLASAGLSVWIDQSGIDVATSWSGEIVDAINECKAFVVLLSPSSMESHNVMKEVSLASEKRKKILPLDLEPVALTRDFEYQLAGIQRAPMTNIDAIIRALGKLGLQATSAPSYQIVKDRVAGAALGTSIRSSSTKGGEVVPGAAQPTREGRKSLMILPFEDLSPTGDNGWFADGIVTELIGKLSNVKALKLADSQATKEFKKYHGQLTTYAKEMGIRYFVQGDVRKFGDQIKINTRLLDIETGDHLWQDSMKGTMEDIFDIQENVAEKVAAGLNIILTSEEEEKVKARGTASVEAYELLIRANEYHNRHTLEGYRLAVQLCDDAIAIDPTFANVIRYKAGALARIYRTYDRDPNLLAQAEALVQEALRVKPELLLTYIAMSEIFELQGRTEEAERVALEFVERSQRSIASISTLGNFYLETAQSAKAVVAFEEVLQSNPEDLRTSWNLVVAHNQSGDLTARARVATHAIPYYQRMLRLQPDKQTDRIAYAIILCYAGRPDEASREAEVLDAMLTDGAPLYNLACLWQELGDGAKALRAFRRALDAGYRKTVRIKEFLEDNEGGRGDLLKREPEYAELKKRVDEIVAGNR